MGCCAVGYDRCRRGVEQSLALMDWFGPRMYFFDRGVGKRIGLCQHCHNLGHRVFAVAELDNHGTLGFRKCTRSELIVNKVGFKALCVLARPSGRRSNATWTTNG